jgi:septum site-determining protein MinD
MIIGIASGKGGVGKSTLTVNLGLALSDFGIKTMIVDANLTNGNLSCMLGTPLPKHSIQEVLLNRATLESAVFDHPRGVKLLSSALPLNEAFSVKPYHLKKLEVEELRKMADVILFDTPGTLGENTMQAFGMADAVAIVTNHDVTSYTDAVKTRMFARKMDVEIIGAVLNKSRVSRKNAEKEVSSWLKMPLIGNIPFDRKIPESGENGIPPLHYNMVSDYSIEVKSLAAAITGIRYKPPGRFERFIGRIFRRRKY